MVHRACALEYSQVGVISLHEFAKELSVPVAPPWVFRVQATRSALVYPPWRCIPAIMPPIAHGQSCTQLVRILLEHGLDVMLNDLDAIWLRDPHTEIFAHLPSADIIAQRSSYPGVMGRTGKKVKCRVDDMTPHARYCGCQCGEAASCAHACLAMSCTDRVLGRHSLHGVCLLPVNRSHAHVLSRDDIVHTGHERRPALD